MFITPSFKQSLIVEQFQGNYLKNLKGHFSFFRYEQAFLTTLLQGKKTHFWIGFNDRHVEGSFFWTDNSPTKYTNWNVNEPQNYGWSRDCVDMTPYGNAGRWGTVQCYQKKGFICETGLWKKCCELQFWMQFFVGLCSNIEERVALLWFWSLQDAAQREMIGCYLLKEIQFLIIMGHLSLVVVGTRFLSQEHVSKFVW